jgi:membrane-bound lytic murein transglycosylase D
MKARDALATVLALQLFVAAADVRALDAEPSPIVRPAALERDVAFWRRVYSEITTSQGFIHDDERLDVVYGVVEVPSDLSPRNRGERIRSAKTHYARILKTLATEPGRPLTAEESRVRALWPEADAHTLRAAAERVRFQLGQADRFREGLVRSGAWIDYIRETLRREGLPVELAALPHVESSFNTYAYSKVGAAGMWQFMPGTGRRFLRIDNVIDERLDPYESTHAAAQFLAQNHAVLGSWPLAITAYNHGTAGMRRAMDQLGTDDIATVVRQYRSRSFGFASRNFYVAFLAAVEIDSDPQQYFPGLSRVPPDSSRTVSLPDYLPAASLASAMSVPDDVLRALNPALLESVWNGSRHVPRGYPLRIPAPIDFDDALQRIPASERFAAQVPDTHHTVRRGDTLSTIARRYDASMARIAALNGLRAPYRIRAGQVLVLPDGASVAATPDSEASPPAAEPVAILAATAGPDAVSPDRSATGSPRAHGPAHRPRSKVDEGTGADGGAVVASGPSTVVIADTADPGPALIEGAASASTADPADYTVAADGTIRVEAAETLGHYADWLELRASELRALNDMRYGSVLQVGRRLRLDFSRVSAEQFEQRRLAHHQALQASYFTQHHITGSEVHTVRSGESVWLLSQQRYDLPLWLLRQYNPDVDFAALQPGTRLVIPRVRRLSAESST